MKLNYHQLSKIIFFGTDEFAVLVLEELRRGDLSPELIVTTPDKPRGRKLLLTPPPVKLWAEKHSIPYLQPEKLSDWDLSHNLKTITYNLFIVASYGKILPKSTIDQPEFEILNVHPSLLPKYRGPSPIQTAILNGDTETGVTIIKLDEQMDHGPVLKSKKLKVKSQNYQELRDELAHLGGKLLLEVIPDWLAGKIKPTPQDDRQATYTKKISKEDGLINLTDNPILNYRKFLAYTPWPGVYLEAPTRAVIKQAHLENGEFIIDRVVPAGRREMSWSDFTRGFT